MLLHSSFIKDITLSFSPNITLQVSDEKPILLLIGIDLLLKLLLIALYKDLASHLIE